MICALVKVPGWSQSLTWLPTWYAVNLLADDCWGHKLDIQRFDDTLSWAILALGSNSLMGRWSPHCLVIFSWFCLCFKARRSTGSDLLQSSILIWRALSVFLLALGGRWSSFWIFRSRSGSWLHSRRLSDLLGSLNWWRRFQWIVHCSRDNFWLSLLVFDHMPHNIALTFISLLMLGFYLCVHSWDGWSVQQRQLQIGITNLSIYPWVGIGTLEAVTTVGSLRCIVLVLLLIRCLHVFLWCTIGACSWLHKLILHV